MSVFTVDSSVNMHFADMHTSPSRVHTSPLLQATSSDSQLSTSTTAAPLNRISTPPSSLSSANQSPGEANGFQTSPSNITGKKRTATGHLKEPQNLAQEALRLAAGAHHARTSSNASVASNGSVVELSQQLRTRLTYAMLKVQNGWQNRSLEEVESLASQSPRSTTAFPRSLDTSPRTNLTAQFRREQSDGSSGSDTALKPNVASSKIKPNGMGVTSPSGRRALAPPADIVPGQRRKPTPNFHLQTGKPVRPMGSQRTPSQNAAMEADAVETLLFMASPNNSGHHPPPYSPVSVSVPSTQLHPSQASPLRSQFNPSDTLISPKRVAFSSEVQAYTQKKDAMIKALVEGLDDEGNAELDEAVRLMEQRQTTRLST